jgi:glycerol-3-phosphate acyltransferase PlsY
MMDAGFVGLYVAGVVAAYLLGAVPFGLLIGLARGIDIRQHGSKNIGANNVARTVGRPWGVLTFALDAGKMWMSFGAAAFLGHLFPVFLKFKGGKGVATGFGALLAVYPIVTFPALLAIGSWAICVKITRYVGLSSSVASAVLAMLTILWPAIMHAWSSATREAADGVSWATQLPFVVTTTLLAVLVIYRHRGNFKRMLEGTEPRVGANRTANRAGSN